MTQASPKQKARFFALAYDLGDDAATVKQRAKQHFGVASFNDLTAAQLSDLIDRLLVREELPDLRGGGNGRYLHHWPHSGVPEA